MTNEELLVVSSSPHMKSKRSTKTIMLDVAIALLPALGWSVYKLGVRSLLITLVCVLTCIFCEFIYEKIMKLPSTTGDLSAVVTGMLLAFNLPVTIPMWMPVLGGVFAIIIVKMLFGGIGQNIFNPALAARVFLFLSFPAYMIPNTSNYSETIGKLVNNGASGVVPAIDSVAGATPLSVISGGAVPSQSLFDAFIGNINGVIGEISALMLIIGGIYLVSRRVISWHIPVAFLGTVAVISFFVAPEIMGNMEYVGYQLCGGGLMLGAIYMATDYATSPVTKIGRIIFGVGCGLITVFIRLFSSNAEGVSFAILIMNCFVWYIDRFTMPKKFGSRRKAKKGA